MNRVILLFEQFFFKVVRDLISVWKNTERKLQAVIYRRSKSEDLCWLLTQLSLNRALKIAILYTGTRTQNHITNNTIKKKLLLRCYCIFEPFHFLCHSIASSFSKLSLLHFRLFAGSTKKESLSLLLLLLFACNFHIWVVPNFLKQGVLFRLI